MEQELRAIALGLEWAESRGIDLEERVGTVTLLRPDELLDLRDALRVNRRLDRAGNAETVVPSFHYARCCYFRDYLIWRAQDVMARIQSTDDLLAAKIRIELFESTLTTLLRKTKGRQREGIGRKVAARFRAVINPEHPENPFRDKHKVRNYALLMCYMELGIRFSEALNIKGGDLVLDGDHPTVTIHRRADDKDDPRSKQPLTKTASRILPLGNELREILRLWITRHRSDKTCYPGAKRTPYVFVSELGRPIGKSTVYDIFVLLRKRVSELTPVLSAHLLRHEWNDRFSDLADETGITEVRERQERAYLMGWSKNSTMPETYTQRSTRRAASKASLALQRKSVEGRNR